MTFGPRLISKLYEKISKYFLFLFRKIMDGMLCKNLRLIFIQIGLNLIIIFIKKIYNNNISIHNLIKFLKNINNVPIYFINLKYKVLANI